MNHTVNRDQETSLLLTHSKETDMYRNHRHLTSRSIPRRYPPSTPLQHDSWPYGLFKKSKATIITTRVVQIVTLDPITYDRGLHRQGPSDQGPEDSPKESTVIIVTTPFLHPPENRRNLGHHTTHYRHRHQYSRKTSRTHKNRIVDNITITLYTR